ncbi:MAG TPA: amidohydrolase family protein [Candidatus Binatia bacterium]|nr:amidohydrolase family protein [Candidatus Binatia bacterium]
MSDVVEEIVEPGLRILDPHHHLWDRPTAILKDLPPLVHPFMEIIRRVPRYLLDELLADLGDGHDVRGTVYLECGAMYRASGPEALRCVGETEFVNGIAAMTASGIYGDVRACAGIVGHADLTMGAAVEEVLAAHIAAAPDRFRGIRHSASYDDDPGVLGPLAGYSVQGRYRDGKFREGFAMLGKLGLSFDAWLLEPQLPDLIDLAHAFEGTTIVLDHVGTPLGIGAYAGRRQERFDVWRANVEALASCPNVVVKLGGLAMPFAGFPWSYDKRPSSSQELAAAWKPYLDVCIQAFGPQRAMLESNFPVDSFTCSYRTLWNALKRAVADYSQEEKRAMCAETAMRVYRLRLD